MGGFQTFGRVCNPATSHICDQPSCDNHSQHNHDEYHYYDYHPAAHICYSSAHICCKPSTATEPILLTPATTAGALPIPHLASTSGLAFPTTACAAVVA